MTKEIERSVPPHQHCMGGQGSIEKAQTHRIREGLRQGIQFLKIENSFLKFIILFDYYFMFPVFKNKMK